MAHTYYGSAGLILTSISRQNFDSGLSRVDCIYKCRTTSANDLEPTLKAGFRVPDRPEFIIRENATRKDETDGFTTFTTSGFFGSLVTTPDADNPIPSVLGASTGSCNFTSRILDLISGFNVSGDTIYKLQVLGDTLTRKFTMRKIDSVATLVLPKVSLSATILNGTLTSLGAFQGKRFSLGELENKFSRPGLDSTNPLFVSTYERGSLVNSLVGIPEIISVNRSGFGEYDEVTVTWGLKYNDFTLNWQESPGPGWVRPTGIVQGNRINERFSH